MDRETVVAGSQEGHRFAGAFRAPWGTFPEDTKFVGDGQSLTSVPGISCGHRWVTNGHSDLTVNPRRQVCLDCYATCQRDGGGVIVEYDHPAWSDTERPVAREVA